VAEKLEHEKLRAVADVSQEIGDFLDVGLGRMGLQLYECVEVACECSSCERSSTTSNSYYGHRHSTAEVETARDGVVYYERWQPTHRSITKILADYFGIDQKKLDSEKIAMLDAQREASRGA
jgi:hypothetical protein